MQNITINMAYHIIVYYIINNKLVCIHIKEMSHNTRFSMYIDSK